MKAPKVHTCGRFGGRETLCGIRLAELAPRGRLTATRRARYGRVIRGGTPIEISDNSADVTCQNCWRVADAGI